MSVIVGMLHILEYLNNKSFMCLCEVYSPVLANFKFHFLILRQIHVCVHNIQKNASEILNVTRIPIFVFLDIIH